MMDLKTAMQEERQRVKDLLEIVSRQSAELLADHNRSDGAGYLEMLELSRKLSKAATHARALHIMETLDLGGAG